MDWAFYTTRGHKRCFRTSKCNIFTLCVSFMPTSEGLASAFLGTVELTICSMPVYLAHRQNFHLLQSLPPNTVDWSMLCPVDMTPESSDFSVPTRSSQPRLIGNAGTPPSWQDSWMKHIPLIGKTLVSAMNISRYVTTLEQNADFIASDLETYESRWSMSTVGIIDGSK